MSFVNILHGKFVRIFSAKYKISEIAMFLHASSTKEMIRGGRNSWGATLTKKLDKSKGYLYGSSFFRPAFRKFPLSVFSRDRVDNGRISENIILIFSTQYFSIFNHETVCWKISCRYSTEIAYFSPEWQNSEWFPLICYIFCKLGKSSPQKSH